jgi:hypothetical protein
MSLMAAARIRFVRRLFAALDRWLEALATLAYGPLPMDEYRVGLGAKLAVLLLFAALVALGIVARW